MAYKNLKDMFVVYEGLLPKRKTDTEEDETDKSSRWNTLMSLINTKPFKKASGLELDIVSDIEVSLDTEDVKDAEDVKDTEDVKDVEQLDLPNPSDLVIQEVPVLARIRKITNKENNKQFQLQLDQYFLEHPEDIEYRDLLTNIAALENAQFDQYATNTDSSALGYFQILDGTRRQYSNITRNDFANNPQAQINVAIQHLKALKEELKSKVDITTIQKSKLTPLQIMYGLWWRPKSMYNYLSTGQDNYRTNQGIDLKEILRRAS